MIRTVRLIYAATWSPDGRTVHHFTRDELVTAGDPRAAGGFVETALACGWAEIVGQTPEPDRNAALDTPGERPEPRERKAAKTAAPRTAASSAAPRTAARGGRGKSSTRKRREPPEGA